MQSTARHAEYMRMWRRERPRPVRPEKPCIVCSAPLPWHHSKYCSVACQHRAEAERRRQREHVCQHCGVSFRGVRHKERNRPVYCSRQCTMAALKARTNVALTCEGCGSVFMRAQSQAANTHYCSMQCRIDSRPLLECGHCGELFQRSWQAVLTIKGDVAFCSKNCAYAWRKEHTRPRRTAKCIGCGSTFEPHRIVSRGAGGRRYTKMTEFCSRACAFVHPEMWVVQRIKALAPAPLLPDVRPSYHYPYCSVNYNKCADCGVLFVRRFPRTYCDQCRQDHPRDYIKVNDRPWRKRTVRCLACDKDFTTYRVGDVLFCSSHCSALFNKTRRTIIGGTGIRLSELPAELLDVVRAYRQLNIEVQRRYGNQRSRDHSRAADTGSASRDTLGRDRSHQVG